MSARKSFISKKSENWQGTLVIPRAKRLRELKSPAPTLLDLVRLLRTRAAWFHQDQITHETRNQYALARDAGLKASALTQLAQELEDRKIS